MYWSKLYGCELPNLHQEANELIHCGPKAIDEACAESALATKIERNSAKNPKIETIIRIFIQKLRFLAKALIFVIEEYALFLSGNCSKTKV